MSNDVFMQLAGSFRNLMLVFDDVVQLWHPDVVAQGSFFCLQFVVDEAVVFARIVLADKADIAPIHTQNT